MADEKKIVWVLGAGFSKALGGPMLNELLTQPGYDEWVARHPELGDAAEAGRLFWGQYRGWGQHKGSNPHGIWAHAEDFLDYVDTAYRTVGHRAERLSRMLDGHPTYLGDIKQFRQHCLKCVAAQCYFTRDADQSLEAWQPYADWGNTLRRGQDAIITFNYDLVVESLAGNHGIEELTHKSPVMPRSEAQCEAEKVPLFNEADGVPILKLHGSIGWVLQNGQIYRAEPEYCLRDPKLTPFIATPGPAKRLHRQRELGPLWKAAENYLKAADVVVFIGYRFPPSDTESKRFILDALAKNESHYLRIHTVLGPNNADTARLRELVRLAMQRRGRESWQHANFRPGRAQPNHYSILTHELYAEDFLGLADMREVWGLSID